MVIQYACRFTNHTIAYVHFEMRIGMEGTQRWCLLERLHLEHIFAHVFFYSEQKKNEMQYNLNAFDKNGKSDLWKNVKLGVFKF